MNTDIIETIKHYKVVPVAAIEDADNALPIANALLEGGLPLIEITFRTDSAVQSIKRIAETCPNILVGAGTVLNVNQAEQAIDAGASFVVSPGFNDQVVDFVMKKGVTVVPGIMTPSEIEKGIGYGLKYVKFFPAEAAGGIKMLNAFSGPYPDIRFMPTGGINIDNVCEYLAHPKVFACGGSWILNKKIIRNRGFDIITDIVKETVKAINKDE